MTNYLRQITEAACALYAVRQADVWDGVRSKSTCLARQQICAALYATRQYSRAEIADLMGFHVTSIGVMIRRHLTALNADPHYADAHLRLLRVLK